MQLELLELTWFQYWLSDKQIITRCNKLIWQDSCTSDKIKMDITDAIQKYGEELMKTVGHRRIRWWYYFGISRNHLASNLHLDWSNVMNLTFVAHIIDIVQMIHFQGNMMANHFILIVQDTQIILALFKLQSLNKLTKKMIGNNDWQD